MTRMDTRHYELRKVIHLAAAQTDADPRTIAKIIAGRPVRGVVGERIQRALVELGVTPPEAKKA